VATHTPVMLIEENGEWTITGHISKGNAQRQTFDGHENTLLIFKGPHAYISPHGTRAPDARTLGR